MAAFPRRECAGSHFGRVVRQFICAVLKNVGVNWLAQCCANSRCFRIDAAAVKLRPVRLEKGQGYPLLY